MEYVTKCTLDVDGQSIEDFKSFTEKERELAKPVNLMNKTGFAGMTARYQMEVEYVVPSDSPEFDWDVVKGGVLSVEFENGTRKTFSGVRTLKVGDEKIDGENETVKQITLGAEKRVVE